MTAQNWFQHALRQPGWRPTRAVIALGTLFLFVGILIGGLYLSQSATSSAVGRELEELISQRNDLEQANERLRAEIASLRGVGRLLSRAGELGFAQAGQDQILYVVIPGYHPDREPIVPLQESERALAAEAPPAPAYEESFVGWVQQQIDAVRRQIEGYAQEAP